MNSRSSSGPNAGSLAFACAISSVRRDKPNFSPFALKVVRPCTRVRAPRRLVGVYWQNHKPRCNRSRHISLQSGAGRTSALAVKASLPRVAPRGLPHHVPETRPRPAGRRFSPPSAVMTFSIKCHQLQIGGTGTGRQKWHASSPALAHKENRARKMWGRDWRRVLPRQTAAVRVSAHDLPGRTRRSAPLLAQRKQRLKFSEFGWRPEPESNRRARICSPLRNHSAIGPPAREMRGQEAKVNRIRSRRGGASRSAWRTPCSGASGWCSYANSGTPCSGRVSAQRRPAAALAQGLLRPSSVRRGTIRLASIRAADKERGRLA